MSSQKCKAPEIRPSTSAQQLITEMVNLPRTDNGNKNLCSHLPPSENVPRQRMATDAERCRYFYGSMSDSTDVIGHSTGETKMVYRPDVLRHINMYLRDDYRGNTVTFKMDFTRKILKKFFKTFLSDDKTYGMRFSMEFRVYELAFLCRYGI